MPISAAGPYFGIGGALENNSGFDNTSPSNAQISNCLFLDNLATGGAGASGNAGAIDNEGVGAIMTLSYTALIGNRSVGGPNGDGLTTFSQGIGGGLINLFATLTVKNSAFIGNQAIGGGGGSNVPAGESEGVGGGGAFATAGTASVTDSTFSGNQATGGNSSAAISRRVTSASDVTTRR